MIILGLIMWGGGEFKCKLVRKSFQNSASGCMCAGILGADVRRTSAHSIFLKVIIFTIFSNKKIAKKCVVVHSTLQISCDVHAKNAAH